MFSGRWEKTFGCLAKQFGHVRQILTPRVQSNVFLEYRFFEKTKFFDNSRNLSDGFWIVEKNFWQKTFGRVS